MCVLKKKILFEIAIATLFLMWSLPAFKKSTTITLGIVS